MEKLPTFELTGEGEINGITLVTNADVETSQGKFVALLMDRKGNFAKLGEDGQLYPLTDEKPEKEKSKEESPAEKAHEIFEKMLNAEDPMGNYPMRFDTAKQCALIAVDEVLKLHKKVALNTLYFYVEVRKEILNYKKPE